MTSEQHSDDLPDATATDGTGDGDAPTDETIEIEAVLVDLGIPDDVIDAIPADVAATIAGLAADKQAADDAKLRALADFRNFQRRSIENEARARRDGLASVVRALMPAIDHFDLALQSAASATSVEQLVQGVQMVRNEIGRSLESNGVAVISAAPGDEFEPGRHEALGMMPPGQSPEGAASGSVAVTVSPGFAIGELVLRPAKVMLVPESSEG
ncbi:MAG: protein GrpE [Planctomycetota bacterium]|jgi:molecular chaperone GrpE